MRWLICYDIADERRLARLHRYLSAQALMLQYSVDLGAFTDAELAALLDGLRARIAPDADDVRLYPLTPRTEAQTLGKEAELAAALLNGACTAHLLSRTDATREMR